MSFLSQLGRSVRSYLRGDGCSKDGYLRLPRGPAVRYPGPSLLAEPRGQLPTAPGPRIFTRPTFFRCIQPTHGSWGSRACLQILKVEIGGTRRPTRMPHRPSHMPTSRVGLKFVIGHFMKASVSVRFLGFLVFFVPSARSVLSAVIAGVLSQSAHPHRSPHTQCNAGPQAREKNNTDKNTFYPQVWRVKYIRSCRTAPETPKRRTARRPATCTPRTSPTGTSGTSGGSWCASVWRWGVNHLV